MRAVKAKILSCYIKKGKPCMFVGRPEECLKNYCGVSNGLVYLRDEDAEDEEI